MQMMIPAPKNHGPTADQKPPTRIATTPIINPMPAIRTISRGASGWSGGIGVATIFLSMVSFGSDYDSTKVCFAYFAFVSGETPDRKKASVLRYSSFLSHPHGDAGSALEFAPADPGAFDRAQDCFPDAIAEHRTINQTHRQNAPGAQDWFAFQDTGERGE
jgi:hypothetical protein